MFLLMEVVGLITTWWASVSASPAARGLRDDKDKVDGREGLTPVLPRPHEGRRGSRRSAVAERYISPGFYSVRSLSEAAILGYAGEGSRPAPVSFSSCSAGTGHFHSV